MMLNTNLPLMQDQRPAQAGRVARLNRPLLGMLTVPGLLGYGLPIPPEERVLLTDISRWNGDVDFNAMRIAGAVATRMRASLCYLNNPECATDPKYATNSRNAAAANYPYGVYHFLSDTLPGATQADYFLAATAGARGVLPACVDVELAYVTAAKVRAFVEHAAETLGYYLDIYTSANYWGKVIGATDKAWLVANCKLWVAHWGTLTPLLPYGWTDYTCHQYSADGNYLAAKYGCSNGDPDIDLNYARKSWLAQYVDPQPDWRQAITAWARTMGYDGPGPE